MADSDYISECISDSVGIMDSELEQLIIHTIARLPEEVQEFACDRCRYLSIGRNANAITLSGSIAFPHPEVIKSAIEHIKSAIEQGKIEDEQGKIEELLSNPPKLILFSDRIVEEYETEDVLSIIAHEIAHAYLGHDEPAKEVKIFRKKEVDACELARQWGFSGRGTNAEERAAFFDDYQVKELGSTAAPAS